MYISTWPTYENYMTQINASAPPRDYQYISWAQVSCWPVIDAINGWTSILNGQYSVERAKEYERKAME